MSPAVLFAIGLVFLGCCSNVVFLELIVKDDPGAGNIVTFAQFLFIGLEGLIFTSHFLQKKAVVPMRKYMVLVTLYFTVSVINNYAYNFNIPMPLHMIFRAGSLIANMMLGILLLKKEYPPSKYVAVVMITVGISMATIASAQQLQPNNSTPNQTDPSHSSTPSEHSSGEGIVTLSIGITMLLFALFMSARMGIYQEVLYKEHGKHPREAMFYTHALPLPGFLLLGSDIWSRVLSFSTSEPIVSFGFVSLPKMWAYLLGNCITQYICIRGVFVLTTECPSLVVTLVITLRKFFSLLFSILYFRNPFTLNHWLATLLVFTGTALFAGVFHWLAKWVVTIGQKKPKEE